MKIFPIIFAFGFAGLLKAQPILKSESINPVIGDEYQKMMGPYLAPGDSGANKTWDLSTHTITSTVIYKFMPAPSDRTTTANLNMVSCCLFSASSTAYKTSSDGSFTYYDAEDLMRFPFAFNDFYSDTWSGISNNSISSGMQVTINGTATVRYDGFGTLVLPTATLSNIARVHSFRKYSWKPAQGSYVSCATDEYSWYRNGEHLPLAAVMSYSFGSSVTKYTYLAKTTSLPVSIKEREVHRIDLSIFPNPTSIALNLKVQDGMLVQKVEIYDMQGRLIQEAAFEKGENNLQLDVQSLPEGIYTALVREFEGKVSVDRFTIQH